MGDPEARAGFAIVVRSATGVTRTTTFCSPLRECDHHSDDLHAGTCILFVNNDHAPNPGIYPRVAAFCKSQLENVIGKMMTAKLRRQWKNPI